MKEDNINVFFTINNSYSKYLAVSITSIIKNTDRFINFYILDGGISKNNKERIQKLKSIKDFYIEYLPIDKSRFETLPANYQKHVSLETNYRFLVSSLKSNMEKCIFLDADLIFIGNIENLWNINIDKYYMAGVPDQGPLLKDFNWTKEFPYPKSYRYLNTGVTVFNLKKWREDNIEEKIFNNIKKFESILKFPDQDILNITLYEKVLELPHYFNAMPVQNYVKQDEEIEAWQNTIVVHWAGAKKPWINPSYNKSDYFWEYAKLTPFYEEIIYANVQYKPPITQVMPERTRFYENFLQRIFSIKNFRMNNKDFKVITILGIRIKFQKRNKK